MKSIGLLLVLVAAASASQQPQAYCRPPPAVQEQIHAVIVKAFGEAEATRIRATFDQCKSDAACIHGSFTEAVKKKMIEAVKTSGITWECERKREEEELGDLYYLLLASYPAELWSMWANGELVCGQKGSGSRIINGIETVDATLGEFPWQISLRYGTPRHHICGGTIIGNQYILCAAHCFGNSQSPSDFTVRVGELYLNKEGITDKDFAIAEVHVHHRYGWPKTFSRDIALLKLAEPLDFSGPHVGPACVPPFAKDYRGTQNCILSGWGLIKRFPATLAERLQKVTGKIWTREDLRNEWSPAVQHLYTIGFGEPSWSACIGDSGGPLVCPNGNGAYDVVGVVSFGPSTCSGKPAVFTSVSAYSNWISEKSGGAI